MAIFDPCCKAALRFVFQRTVGQKIIGKPSFQCNICLRMWHYDRGAWWKGAIEERHNGSS